MSIAHLLLSVRCIQMRVQGQPCSYALAAGREWILHSLSEHARQRILPICGTASWAQGICGIGCANGSDHTKLAARRNPEGAFVSALL
jgi:hypothetical protein